MSCNLVQAIRSLQAAKQKYKELKPNAIKLCRDYLYAKAYDQASSVTTLEHKQAQCLLWEEQQWEAARHVRGVLGHTQNGSVDWIEVETGPAVEGANPILIRHSDKDTVEQKIMENNKSRFQLMESTPPMNESLLSNLGFLSDTDTAKRILNGTYICPEGVDAYTKNFIASLQITAPINLADFIPNTVSLQDYQAHWKPSKERTSSSISGLHFGHWKAAAESNFLSKLHALFTDIIISTSYSPIRWQQGLSVMLEKKKGVCIPSKLHAILLMEANFNFPNELFFGRCMHGAMGRIPEPDPTGNWWQPKWSPSNRLCH